MNIAFIGHKGLVQRIEKRYFESYVETFSFLD